MKLLCLVTVVTLLSLPAIGGETDTNTIYMALLARDIKIGWYSFSSIVEGNTITSNTTMAIIIKRGETKIRHGMKATEVETKSGKPVSFSCTMEMGDGGQVKITGLVNKQGKLDVVTTENGKTSKKTVDWPEGALMSGGLSLLKVSKGLKKGTTFNLVRFDPMSQTEQIITIKVGEKQKVDLLGRVVMLTKITETRTSEDRKFERVMYVDDNVNILKEEADLFGMKMVALACSKEFAFSESDLPDYIAAMLIPCPSRLTQKQIKEAGSISYRLSPKPTSKMKIALPSTANQVVKQADSGDLIITVTPKAARAGGQMPYKGTDTAALEALKPNDMLQSEDKLVIKLAAQAVGDITDPAKAAKAIEKFVADYITDKMLSVGEASAAEVALSRQGDCSEHAVLAAAMCQSAGIPARVASGLVYVEKFRDKSNVFAPHGWFQVYLSGQWIDFDATLKGFTPGHIALQVGDGTQTEFPGLARMLRNYKFAEVKVAK